MPVINILQPHVADMIAAGEVVERPASVIKELMENAFDAGAKNVKVEIHGGGATFIRVTDDGCGMAPEDAGIAFLRHATSKLKDERGLEAIETMGFRGEALAAISSVSHIELLTRRRGDSSGTKLTLNAGDIEDMIPIGCPEGTCITVKDIFFNTPARLKFLKSDRSEAGACLTSALRCALGRPEISVRFIRDGKEEFFSPGDGMQSSCIYSLLGRDLAATLIECDSENEGLKLSGFISSPSACRGNRSAQYFFCNGRWIKSPMLQSALEQGYKNSLLTGRFPACVLYLDISCGSVDVNVHPAKTEVKFSAEKSVFDLVYHAVRSALENEDATVKAGLSSAQKAVPKPREDFYQSMSASAFRENGYKPAAPARSSGFSAPARPAYAPPRPAAPSRSFSPAPAPSFSSVSNRQSAAPSGFSTKPEIKYAPPVSYGSAPTPAAASFKSSENSYRTVSESLYTPKEEQEEKDSPEISDIYTKHFPQAVENYVENVESSQKQLYKIIGEALKTYIIVEKGEELLLIDKHAAHERMIFDRLKAKSGEIPSQNLLTPIPLRLNPEEAELIEENGELLLELGFEIEPFGENEYILRALPADMEAGDAEAAVEEICEKLRKGTAPTAQSARDEILHTVACKAAIKAGWDTDRRELEVLVKAVVSGEIKYCPHGRPLSVSLSKKELDKLFKRIV